ncbi:MAG TPA: glycosyltransferase family protein [Phnomibacter sp.]|nr:glycosyltransferase family protein [Phnomibacter sp.]
MWKHNSLVRALREASQLPVENYDLVLNDFDFITARACEKKNVPSIQFGHQASFMSPHTPRPAQRSLFGEMILKKYAPATHYLGLHFEAYDQFILPPVIKQTFIDAEPTNEGHITVYLSAYEQHCLEHHFRALPHLHFHWFLHGITRVERQGNITFYPVSNQLFNESLLSCHGIITGGGFETPAEALYLQKRLLSIPIRAQYEQQCNAAALAKAGIAVLANADTPHFAQDISQWLEAPPPAYVQQANDIPATLERLLALRGMQQEALTA